MFGSLPYTTLKITITISIRIMYRGIVTLQFSQAKKWWRVILMMCLSCFKYCVAYAFRNNQMKIQLHFACFNKHSNSWNLIQINQFEHMRPFKIKMSKHPLEISPCAWKRQTANTWCVFVSQHFVTMIAYCYCYCYCLYCVIGFSSLGGEIVPSFPGVRIHFVINKM